MKNTFMTYPPDRWHFNFGCLLLVAILFLSSASFTGRHKRNLIFHQQQLSTFIKNNIDWIHDTTAGNVDFYHLIGVCDGRKLVYLRFNNRNNHKVKLSWKEVFVTQFEKSKEGFRGEKQLVLPSGETSASGCNDLPTECIISAVQVSATYVA